MKLFVKIIKIILFALLLLYIGAILVWNFSQPAVKWKDEKFNIVQEVFPDDFMWGTATAAHQVEGNNDNNNWYAWEHTLNEDQQATIHNNDKSGAAADHWNRYPQDIQLMKDLGMNAYRFSVEWSKIEPERGLINVAAIQHYHDLVDSLLAEGMTPMITLHHFTQPIWFDELGGFEKEENINDFVKFSRRIFEEFRNKVEYYCTINEPNVFVTGGYVRGDFPPGKKDPQLAGEVLFNLLKAHTLVYRTIKALPGGQKVKVGIVKDIFVFEPKNRFNPGDWLVARTVDKAFNESTLSYLKTGVFNFEFPPVSITKKYQYGKGSYDFAGLNYYSHIIFDFSFDQDKALEPYMPEDEIKTDMEYTMYPEGLYTAIKRIATLGAPIIITENGVADHDDDIRGAYIQKHLAAVSQAMKEGYDVDGYFYWSLMDNFEWAEGYEMKFGLYALDTLTQERTLRKGAETLKTIIEGN